MGLPRVLHGVLLLAYGSLVELPWVAGAWVTHIVFPWVWSFGLPCVCHASAVCLPWVTRACGFGLLAHESPMDLS